MPKIKFLNVLRFGITCLTLINISKPKINKSTLKTPNFKMFRKMNEVPITMNLRIGIFPKIPSKKLREELKSRLRSEHETAIFYKQFLFRDASQYQIRADDKEAVGIKSEIKERLRDYLYYPTAYAKGLTGWNIFDYLAQNNGQKMVRLTSGIRMIGYSGLGTIV